MLWLHTARAKNPERTQIPNQTHLSTSDSYEYHPDISWTPPRHPPDTPQTSPGNKRCQQMTTDANRDKEPARDTPRHWRVLFEYVWQCQLAFVGVFLFMEVTRGCLGDVWGCLRGVWGVSEGIWVLFLEIGSAQMCFGFSAFAVRSHNIILAQPGKAWLFSPDHSETSKYQNVSIWGWQKWLSCMISLFFNARQKDIRNGSSCKWSPCIIVPPLRILIQFCDTFNLLMSYSTFSVDDSKYEISCLASCIKGSCVVLPLLSGVHI